MTNPGVLTPLPYALPGVCRHAGRQKREIERIAIYQRKIVDQLAGQRLADGGVFGKQRHLRFHNHGWPLGAGKAQGGVAGYRCVDIECDFRNGVRVEIGSLHLQRIIAGRQRTEKIPAGAAALSVAVRASIDVGQGNVRSGDHRA